MADNNPQVPDRGASPCPWAGWNKLDDKFEASGEAVSDFEIGDRVVYEDRTGAPKIRYNIGVVLEIRDGELRLVFSFGRDTQWVPASACTRTEEPTW